MQYTNSKKALPDVQIKDVDKKHSLFSETRMIVILILTSSVFLVMLMLEFSIVFHSDVQKVEVASVAIVQNSTDVSEVHSNALENTNLDGLIMVSHTNDISTVISVICTGFDRSSKFANCYKLISTKKGYHVFLPPKSEVLGNGKLVMSLVWKEITLPGEASDGTITLYSLDMKSMDSQPIAFRGPYDNGTLATYNPFEIIPYQDKFDIFVKSTKYCNPPDSFCLVRYSDEGKWLGTFDFRFDTKNKAFNLEKLYPLNKFNATSGYVYISLQNSVVKLVDQYLVSVAEKEFLGMITSHSVLNGSIGICTVINPLTPFTMCSILNSSLVIKRQYVLPNNLQKYDWKIFNLADKSSLAVSIPKQLSTAIEVKRLAPNGKTSLSHYFDLKNCESDYNPFDKFDELPGNYCFAFNCFSKSITYCLDSSKTVNLTILSN